MISSLLAITAERFFDTFDPEKDKMDLFMLCFALLFIESNCSLKTTSAPYRAAGIMVLYALMKERGPGGRIVLLSKVQSSRRSEILDGIAEFTATNNVNSRGPYCKGYFQKWGVSPALFYDYGLCSKRFFYFSYVLF